MRFILLLFISFKVGALTSTHLHMKPNRDYMNYFLTSYVEWFSKTFNTDFYGTHKKFISDALLAIDHWKVQGQPEFDQILAGESIVDGKKVYSYRIYLHPELRKDPFVIKNKLPGEPLFYEWNSEGKSCFLILARAAEIDWEIVPKRENSVYFKHYCDGKVRQVTMTSKTLAQWKNPFFGQAPEEIRTYSKEELSSVFYFVKFTHAGIIPKKHLPFINAHGETALLPFDKFSTDKNGELTIFYP